MQDVYTRQFRRQRRVNHFVIGLRCRDAMGWVFDVDLGEVRNLEALSGEQLENVAMHFDVWRTPHGHHYYLKTDGHIREDIRRKGVLDVNDGVLALVPPWYRDNPEGKEDIKP